MSERSANYFVLDGVDGCGKSTQTRQLADRLEKQGTQVDAIAEPGSNTVALTLRELLLDPRIELLPETEVDLFTAARRELAHRVIRPALAAGNTIVSDRSWVSSVAMQGFGRGLDVNDIIEQSKRAIGDLFLPDALVIIDVPVELAEERVAYRGIAKDRFEKERKDFFTRARDGYLWVAEKFDGIVVEGSGAIEAVHSNVCEALGVAT